MEAKKFLVCWDAPAGKATLFGPDEEWPTSGRHSSHDTVEEAIAEVNGLIASCVDTD